MTLLCLHKHSTGKPEDTTGPICKNVSDPHGPKSVQPPQSVQEIQGGDVLANVRDKRITHC